MFSKIIPALRDAILGLPEKEKDKVLLRLIRKDKTLIQQLHYQLLENEFDLEERRKDTFEKLDENIENIRWELKTQKYHQPRRLLTELRALSGIINHHFLITKDKTGELEMRLYILNQVFLHAETHFSYHNHSNEKLLAYIAGRIKNSFSSYLKLHEDLQYDYIDMLNEVLSFAYSSSVDTYLKKLNIPKEV